MKIETTRGTEIIRSICDSFFALVPPFDLFLRICPEHAAPLKDHVLEKKDEMFIFYLFLYFYFMIIFKK